MPHRNSDPPLRRPNSADTESTAMPRLLTRAQAMAYLALSHGALAYCIRRGLIPGPLPGNHRWERHSIDAADEWPAYLRGATNAAL